MTPTRSSTWKWTVCGLFLLASAINYMDRQTLANASVRISTEFHLNQEQYGNLELGFGWAFAAGSIVFGLTADRFPVRIVYPTALFLWSMAGFLTGLAHNYKELMICRTLLGLFEAGHWPCAVKAIQGLLEPKDRAMGNSVLQSGTSIGAVITPLILALLLTPEISSWRFAFQAVGCAGVLWIGLWFTLVKRGDLSEDKVQARDSNIITALKEILSNRRMWIVIVVIALINTNWQIIRAWLPRILIQGRGYSESQALYFNSLFYIATDVGCIGAGALTLWWHKRGASVDTSRRLAFLSCALLSAVSLVAAWMPKGPLLLTFLLLIGAGALGVFPIYHAFTQDISRQHQGKVTGIAGVAAWALSPAHTYFGRLVDRTGSFDLGFALVGILPLIAFAVLWFAWPSISSNSVREEIVQH